MPLAPPAPRLPPLSRLWATALALHHGGYAPASRVLGVTPGAVRERVRAVELALNTRLLETLPHGLRPTDAGAALGPRLLAGFAALERAIAPLGPPPLPLNALLPFETVLRLGGFAAAASELGVTPSAVAGRMRGVEDWAGQPLFERHAKGVMSRTKALAVHDGLASALGTIAAAIESVGRAPVRIAALPAVAQLWLSPRLPALRNALPGVSVSVTALEHPPAAKHAPYDLALFFGIEGGTVMEQDALFPVCTPALAARLAHPSDLETVPCLGDAVWSGDWAAWSRAHGIPAPRPILHSLYALAVDEALAGAGVLMGHWPLVRRHLDNGALVAPFGCPLDGLAPLRMTPLRVLTGDAAKVAAWLRGQNTASQGLGASSTAHYIGQDWRPA